MAQLPIRSLILYKQGIGYFQRRGVLEETSISLVAPRDATNDVLKSLNVLVHEGGPVLSVDYETPEDKAKVLDTLSVKLADRSSMVDLLSSLRGSQVTLQLENELTATGRIIGVEASLDPVSQPPTVLLQQTGQNDVVQVLPIARIRGLALQDQQAATDVAFFLDMSRTEQTRTTLTIRLTEGKHDLEMSYLAPSPTWRVSYRLISSGPGQARLIAWGLFDNSIGEDLDDVTLTLMSGRPISFEYGLYQSRVPARPQVADDPSPLESLSGNPLMAESISTISHDLRSPLAAMLGYSKLLEEEAFGDLNDKQRHAVKSIKNGAQQMNDLLANLLDVVRLRDKSHDPMMPVYRSGPLGDLKVSANYFLPVSMGNAEPEFLIYRVEKPISVKRGQSAMVPLLDAAVTYEDLCVYNGSKMPNHPLLVWRLQNSTGVALEQGPVTVVRESRYAGEGIIRFSGVGDDIQIPYALEFGIVVSEERAEQPGQFWRAEFISATKKASISIARVTEYTYLLTSHVNRPITVQIEHRDPNRAEYVEMPQPTFALAGHTRWSVEVPANGEATFLIREREIQTSSHDIASWHESYVEALRKAGLLPARIDSLLTQMVNEQRQATNHTQEVKNLQAEYTRLLERQDQLRKNLGALGDSDREVTLRNRILDDLEASENRRRAVETTFADLEGQIKQRQEAQQRLIDEIFSTPNSGS